MNDCPQNAQNRYSMLKTELIKFLQNEKPRTIFPRSTKQDELSDLEKDVIEREAKTDAYLEAKRQLDPEVRKPMGIAGMFKQQTIEPNDE